MIWFIIYIIGIIISIFIDGIVSSYYNIGTTENDWILIILWPIVLFIAICMFIIFVLPSIIFDLGKKVGYKCKN